MTTPDWARRVTPNPAVHTPPPQTPTVAPPADQQLAVWNSKLLEMNMQQVALATNNVLMPGPALPQVSGWADDRVFADSDLYTRNRNNQNATISALAGGYRNPASYCRYPIGNVTYSEELNAATPLFGTTDGASTGAAHTHAISYPNAQGQTAAWAVVQNSTLGGYITASLTTVWDTVGMVLRKNAGTLNNVYIEVFREDEAGVLSRTAHSADVSASITTAHSYIEVTLNPPIITQAGERYPVQVRNSSTVNTFMSVQGILQTSGSVDAGLLATGATALQTTYTAAEAAALRSATDVVPFALLAAKNLAVTPQNFNDDFSRPAIGALWSLISSGANDLDIVGNRLSYTGSSDGWQNALSIYPAATDSLLVECNIYDTALAVTHPEIGLQSCCDRVFSQSVFLAVTSAGAKLYSYASTVLTAQATVSVGGDGFWTLSYNATTNTFTAFKNGQAIGLSWVDSGNIIKHGRDYRYGLLQINRGGGYNAGTIDNFTIRDI